MVGTTRVRLIDTAGIRDTEDAIEAMGVERSRQAIEQADLVIFVCDGSEALTQEDQNIIALCTDKENAGGNNERVEPLRLRLGQSR